MTGRRRDSRDRYDRRRPDLGALDRLMRERAALAPLPPPKPLHKMGDSGDRDHDTDETATTGQRT